MLKDERIFDDSWDMNRSVKVGTLDGEVEVSLNPLGAKVLRRKHNISHR